MKLREILIKYWKLILWVGIPLVSFFMHVHILDVEIMGVHGWRQCETASNIVNFAEGGMDLLSPQVYNLEWEDGLKRMEFPIMQWVFAWFFRMFGYEIWVIRLLSWILGVFAAIGFFRLCEYLFQDKSVAIAGAWLWTFSPILFYYTMNPMPDNLALMAAVWGMAYFVRWYRERSWSDISWCYFFFALATAAKLPFIIFYFMPFGHLIANSIRNQGRSGGKDISTAVPGIVSAMIPGIWYIIVIPGWKGNGVVKGILGSSGTNVWEILRHNLISTFPELLLNYAALPFFIIGLFALTREKLFSNKLSAPFAFLTFFLFAYFAFEINMIGVVHDYYLFPFLPMIFLIAVAGVRFFLNLRLKGVTAFVLLICLVLPVTAGIRAYPRWSLNGIPKDLFKYKTELRSAIDDEAKIIVGHDLSPHIFLFHLHKRGWTVAEGNIVPEKVDIWIAKEAKYLYSTRWSIENHPAISRYIDEQIGEWGIFKVFRLKKDG